MLEPIGQDSFVPAIQPIQMSALYFLIGTSLVVAAGFLGAFFWAMTRGQYEDDYTPSVRILFDDKQKTNTETSNPTLTQTK